MNQEKALAILKSGRNVFLTGSAGSGKTYCLNQYIDYLQERQVAVAITASTGIAATHMNGMTIHSWSGIGIRDALNDAQLKALSDKQYMRKKMDMVQVLIIDEISMLHRRQFELVNRVLQHFKGNELPFGGIQVVFSGDFFQLPPVTREEQRAADKFCFMSGAWVAASPQVCYLTEQHRAEDNQLNRLLNDIRNQSISDASQALIQGKLDEGMAAAEHFPHLYPHNANVDNINARELAAMVGEAHTYTAVKKGNEVLADTLARNILAPEELTLKAGAKVMFVKNNPEKETFNGTLGEVIGFNGEGVARVRLLDGREVYADAEKWQVEDERGKVLASVEQVPLRLAWAITVHKSQGMTLDEASVDLAKTFECGQGYVALSRLKHIDGLRLLGMNDMALTLEPLALKADERFRALSEQHDAALPLHELQNEWDGFIHRSGGETDPGKIAAAKMKQEKIPTHMITKKLLLEGKTVEEVAEQRGIQIGTIIGHLNDLKDDPEIELTTFVQRDDSLVAKLEPLLAAQPADEPLRLKPLYEALNGEHSYNDIKRALLFCVRRGE
ncbi:AAA family ATPase [Cardiobacteriaceae bacterium TAE3-ERU3]|nr:AAA family ATPase [Cardiobacteriaceae bacterium TAE3-ERU3]